MKLVECVPNFSEGRDKKIIEAIAEAIKSVKGATLLDVDPGADTNRTVFTLVGEPQVAQEAAFQAIKRAAELIDMSKHHGEHPRMGATDVCPFIPVSDVSMEECVEIAKQLGKRVGKELQIPVYLYEYAASRPNRRNLAEIRTGEYEALPKKMQDAEWEPDFGPQIFNAKSGATVIGARDFLIAYNINLNTRDKNKANEIAKMIRESGYTPRDASGKFMRDANGEKVIVQGLFTNCKAVGWYIDSYQRAQISMNLTNYKITPPHMVLDKVRELAWTQGIMVTGSELVGLIPKDAILESGKYYLKKLGESAGLPEKMIIESAVQSMGLAELAPFDVENRIIEYAIACPNTLAKMTITAFADELSTDSPAPGGGSVAAVCGAMSAGLTAMVANLTAGKKGYEANWDLAKELAEEAQLLKDKFLVAIDKDTDAFNEMMAAMKLPKANEEEKKVRAEAVQTATKKAIAIPLETLGLAKEAVLLSEKIAPVGNKNALSDAGVAAISANTAAKAAYLNIKINLAGITDENYKQNTISVAELLKDEINRLALKIENSISESL